MKKILFSLLLNILIFSFVFSLFKGIKLPTDMLNLIIVMLSLSIAIMLQKPFLKFLTVKNNLLTYWLSSSLIAIGIFYLLVTLIPELLITETVVPKSDWYLVTISSFKLDKTLTIVVSVLLASLLSGIMEGLKKPTEE